MTLRGDGPVPDCRSAQSSGGSSLSSHSRVACICPVATVPLIAGLGQPPGAALCWRELQSPCTALTGVLLLRTSRSSCHLGCADPDLAPATRGFVGTAPSPGSLGPRRPLLPAGAFPLPLRCLHRGLRA